MLPHEFEDVLDGWVPGTETRLGRMREGEHDHRPGWDITFSAPKSGSLEGLVMGDRRVIRAHDDSVRATLEWIETDLLQTRGWDETAHGVGAGVRGTRQRDAVRRARLRPADGAGARARCEALRGREFHRT